MKSGNDRPLKVGNWIRVTQVPFGLKNSPGLETKKVFEQALGKTFRIIAFGEYGHVELLVSRKKSTDAVWHLDTIWIEPEFVVRSRKPHRRK